MGDSFPQSLALLLTNSKMGLNTLYTIQQRTQVLININNTVLGLLPSELKGWCRVANYRQDMLIIAVINASRKARLNYELPTLLAKLRNTILPSLSFIHIIINPSLLAQYSPNSFSSQPIATKPISEASAKIILQLAKISPNKLQKKLEKLLALAGDRR